ncbi:hypothetical protein [Brevibacterium epidermidis]|uniref:hypothetical protein n=1 Tax=Brevibacterium epidermidis TaxID=1698 RepID=UPI003511CB87
MSRLRGTAVGLAVPNLGSGTSVFVFDNSPYLDRLQYARKVGETVTASPDPTYDGPPRAHIILGVRRSGIRGSLREFFNGSVAIQLSRHQHRPLVVVPLAAGNDGMEDPEAPATSQATGTSPTAEPRTGEGDQ